MTDPKKQLDAIFFVLSDPLRRRVLEAVLSKPGATVTELCNQFPVSRFAVMRHLNTLEEAGFIKREVHSRERHVYATDLIFEDIISDWAATIRQRSVKND